MIAPTYGRPPEDASPDAGVLGAACANRCGSTDIAVIDHEHTLTWEALDAHVNRIATMLETLGIQRGDAVCWQLPNQWQAVAIHLAVLRIGAVSTPIVPIYRHHEVGFILRQSKAPVVFVPGRYRGFDFEAMIRVLRVDLPALRHVVVIGDAAADSRSFDELLRSAGDSPPARENSPDAAAVLLYTSGTTGDPKGVLHTHRTLGNEVRSCAGFFALDDRDVVLMPSPLTHITGLVFGIHLPAALGSAVVLQRRWDPITAWELIRRHECRVVVGATPFLSGLLTASPELKARSSLRLFVCGGADIPSDLIEKATSELDCVVVRAYGSTELPSATACNQADSLHHRTRTDGRPIGAVQIRIVGADGSPVPPGTSGEVHVRGPELFVGYLDASQNDGAFTDDDWFATGDLGAVDTLGYLTITGRLKDVIIRGGENLSTREIESFIAQHQSVVEVAVVGMPDPAMGERVCAFVIVRDGKVLTLSEMVRFLGRFQLAMQKLPERLVVVADLPRTASGKVQKQRLRDRITSILADEVTPI